MGISVLIREVANHSFPLSLPPGQSDAGAEIATSAACLGTQIHFYKPVSPYYWLCLRQNQNNSQVRPARQLDGSSSKLLLRHLIGQVVETEGKREKLPLL